MSKRFCVDLHIRWSYSLCYEAGGPSWVPIWRLQLVSELKWSCCFGLGPTASRLQLTSFPKFCLLHVWHHVFRLLLLSSSSSGTGTINPQDWTHLLCKVSPFSFLCITQALNRVQMVRPFHANASFFLSRCSALCASVQPSGVIERPGFAFSFSCL